MVTKAKENTAAAKDKVRLGMASVKLVLVSFVFESAWEPSWSEPKEGYQLKISNTTCMKDESKTRISE